MSTRTETSTFSALDSDALSLGFKLVHFSLLAFSAIHLSCPVDFQSFPLQSIPPPLQVLLHLLPTLHRSVSYVNTRAHRGCCPNVYVNLSITITNKEGLRVDPRCNPTHTLNPSVTPIDISQLSHSLYKCLAVPTHASSCITRFPLLAPYQELSPNPQRPGATASCL